MNTARLVALRPGSFRSDGLYSTATARKSDAMPPSPLLRSRPFKVSAMR